MSQTNAERLREWIALAGKPGPFAPNIFSCSEETALDILAELELGERLRKAIKRTFDRDAVPSDFDVLRGILDEWEAGE